MSEKIDEEKIKNLDEKPEISEIPEIPEKREEKSTKKKKRWFSKKRKWEENYDEYGNYVPRQKNRNERYSDYYGPIVEDKNGHKAGKFFFKEYEGFGHIHYFGDLVIFLLFAIFIGYGIYNLYYVGGEIRDLYQAADVDLSTYKAFIRFVVYIILILIGIWIISMII